jgi:hypothetical protein
MSSATLSEHAERVVGLFGIRPLTYADDNKVNKLRVANGLATLVHGQRGNRERDHRIKPPPADHSVGEQAD